MVDELIREITEPEEIPSATAKAAARERLLLGAQCERPAPRKRRRLGSRGLAALVALVAVPTGVAVATELSRDGEPSLKSVSECPELLAEAQERNLEVTGLLVASCPESAEVDQALWLLVKLEQRRADLGGGE